MKKRSPFFPSVPSCFYHSDHDVASHDRPSPYTFGTKTPEPAREAAPPDAPRPRRRRRNFLRHRSAAARGPGLSRDRAHCSIARGLAAEGQVDAQGGETTGRERERERGEGGGESKRKEGKDRAGISTGDLTGGGKLNSFFQIKQNITTTRSAPPRGLSPSWPRCWGSLTRQLTRYEKRDREQERKGEGRPE